MEQKNEWVAIRDLVESGVDLGPGQVIVIDSDGERAFVGTLEALRVSTEAARECVEIIRGFRTIEAVVEEMQVDMEQIRRLISPVLVDDTPERNRAERRKGRSSDTRRYGPPERRTCGRGRRR